MKAVLFFSLLFLLVTSSVSRAETPIVRVSAAASLADALKEINALYEKEKGAKVELNLGASSALARQIEAGAPVDVFFSADLAKMEALDKAGLIDQSTEEEQLGNALVVVAPVDSALTISSVKDLADEKVKRLVTGDPKAVPVGVYTKQYLEKLGLWESVGSKIVAAENVRAALAAVEAGNADAGFVYKTDAAISDRVKVIHEVPEGDAPKIIYPMAALKDAKNAAGAKDYLEFLDTPEAHEVFKKFGFVVLPEPVK